MESYSIVCVRLALFIQHNFFERRPRGYTSCPLAFMAEQCPMAWTDLCLFLHSPADGPLSCFQFGAVINKVAMNAQVCVAIYASVWVNAFSLEWNTWVKRQACVLLCKKVPNWFSSRLYHLAVKGYILVFFGGSS